MTETTLIRARRLLLQARYRHRAISRRDAAWLAGALLIALRGRTGLAGIDADCLITDSTHPLHGERTR